MCGKHFPPSPAKFITSLPPNVTSGASLRTCAPHSPGAQRRAGTVESGPFEWTQQYQWHGNFSVNWDDWNQLNKVIASLFWNSMQILLSCKGYVDRETNYARFAAPMERSKLTRGFEFLEYWQNLFIAWEYSLNWFQSEWGLFTVRLSKWMFPILDFNWYLKTSFNIERWVFSMISIFLEKTWINILFTHSLQNAPTP